MSSVWSNYYDSVMYEEGLAGLDQAGNKVYKEPRQINVRDVSGGKVYVIEKEGTSTKYTREYQIPFMVNIDDKINGRIVIDVEPAKDVFGNFHYCIARVL